MSQSGKRFLSGLVNSVFSSKEARAEKNRERSLSAKRLSMEPLEARQLLAIEPTLLSAMSQAEVAQTEVVANVHSVDLSSIATTGAGLTLTVDGSNAASEDTTGTRYIDANLTANIFDRLISCSEMTWAASLANALTYTGWSMTSIVDPTSEVRPEQQTFDYFANSFTNDPSNVALAYAWFMGGANEYTLQGNDDWAQILPNNANGGLFPASSGIYGDPSEYCREFLAAEIASPLYGIATDYLNNNWGVVCEIHYRSSIGTDVGTGNPGQARSTWLTLWGYEYDFSYNPEDKEYYTAIYASNPYTGRVERMTIEWNAGLNSYVLTNFESNISGRVPYIYSFTVIDRMPGYGVLTPDQYEKNDSPADFEIPNAPADLGQIDVVVPSSSTGSVPNGNTFTLDDLTLYAEGSADGTVPADPVDFFKFELTQNASYSDSIIVSYGTGYLNSPLKATLYICGQDGEAYPVDPVEFGRTGNHFVASPSSKTSYYVGEDGKTYSEVTNDLRINISGLTPGFYYLKVEFADDVVGGINTGYSITFNAGYDDLYESNDSFEEVKALPVSAPNRPTANFGVLYGRKFVEDLVLKQYDYNVSETDWFRFEMTSTGQAGSAVNVYYNSTANDINDSDLDFVLYRENPNDPYGRGYTMVDRSWQVMTDVETVSLEGLEPGVYYIKVVGNLAAEDGVFVNVEYKLEILPGVDPNLPPDLRAEVLPGNNWEGPLVIAVDRYVPSDTEQFKSEASVGLDGNVYLNYSFSVYGAQTPDKKATYEDVTLALFINGVRVSAADMRAAIAKSGVVASKATQLYDLFCNGGYTMQAGDSFEVLNFNMGKIASADSLAGKYFDSSIFAPNAMVVVINPDNYTYGDTFGKVVDNFTVTEVSLNYFNGQLFNGTVAASVNKGETVKVFRNNVLVKTLRYGVDDFVFKNGDVVVTSIVNHNYGVDSTSYQVKPGVQGVLEYKVDNNFATAFFVLDNLSEDVFAPNASVTEVMNSTNQPDENPDLGVANIEYLDQNGVCHIDNLVITGKKDSYGAYISDWFRFDLLTSQEDVALGRTNYENAYVQIEMDDQFSAVSDPSNVGDLDLYLYRVIQTDNTISFDEAFERGAYRLSLVATSKDVQSTERINFADYAMDDGTYFVCVSGFNGAANRYSLEIGGFTHSGDILPTDPAQYFTEDNVTILNSVATVKWRVPTTDYVSRAIVSYRAVGSQDWIVAGEFKPSVTSCKIAGLDPNTEYEFQLAVTNFFVQDNPLTATVAKKTADYLNEVVYRAVIVGVSDYPGASADLVAAANDAEAFRDALLTDPQWAEENITVLLNDSATKSNVLDAIASVGYVSDDNDVLVFYFAGSGSRAVTGSNTVGYLKTYGSTRSAYLSSSELADAMSKVAAGSKQFILDAGQVTPGITETVVHYDAFIDKLSNMTKNGASERLAQVAVLTSGENGDVSPVGQGSRTVFSAVLVDAIKYYSEVLTAEEAEAINDANVGAYVTTRPAIESDGRVAFDELADYLNSDKRFEAYEMTAMHATNTEGVQTIMMNGYWSESDEYGDFWLEQDAIVVTTTVDTVDDHDGKISLREAANLIGTTLNRATELKNGDAFTILAGSIITLGSNTGKLVDDVQVAYSNGTFRTTSACSLEIGTKIVDFNKIGNLVGWTSENWNDGNVDVVDDKGLEVADVAFNLRANIGSTIVDKEEYIIYDDLEEGDVLYTAAVNGKAAVVTKIGQHYRLVIDGVVYNKTTGLYRKTLDENGAEIYEPVTISTFVSIDQDVVLKKIVFDPSLEGQAITVNAGKGAIVFTKGAIIDATALKGGLEFNGEGQNALLKVTGDKLVTLIGAKITNSKGAAIIVDNGADFELANSVVYRNDGGAEGLFANDGNMTFVNVTIVNNKANGNLFAGTGTAALKNSIVALNAGGLNGFAFDATCVVVGSATNPGFNDAAKNDYTLVKTSDAVDIGDNSAVNLRCGFVLDYDLAGSERYAIGGTIDAGAFEYTVPEEDRETPSTVVTILADIVDPTDGEISLREAIAYAGTTYRVEYNLVEGDVVTDADGNEYEVKNGRLVSFDGVTAIQYGTYYTVAGVYMVDAYGGSTPLNEGEVVTLASGTKATVVGTKLQYASGVPVEAGATFTREDGTKGALSYGAVVDFHRNDRITLPLTAAMIDPATPVGTFDAGTYVLTYQTNGTFRTTLQVTTTENNQTTTTPFEANFRLVANTPFSFVDEDGSVLTSARIATSRNVDLEDGKYVLINNLTETIDGKSVVIYAAGAQFTLARGVFTDADDFVVKMPKGTQLSAPSGATVSYQTSNFTPANLAEGADLVCADGVTRQFKAGLTLYEQVELGKTIGFKKGLEGGTVVLDRGAIIVERAITLDAALNAGLTVDAQNASRVFTVDTYRESSATATVNMNGLTLVNGAAEEGGLIYVAKGSNLKLTDSALSNATATYGGAIYNAGKTSFEAATKTTSITNTTATQGGAIYNVGTMTASAATINNVTASDKGGAAYNTGVLSLAGAKINAAKANYGGAVYNLGTVSVTKGAEITNSEALYHGGAIYNANAATAINATFSGNKASYGGALYNAAGKASFTNVKALGNKGTYGGAIYDAAQFFATRTVFAENSASISGAALFTVGKSTVVSSLALANKATSSAGEYAFYANDGGALTLVNDTIVGNKVHGVFGKNAAVVINNSIVGQNAGIDLGSNASTFEVEYSMIESTATPLSATNLAYAPNFKSFDPAANWTDWSLMLATGSAAIDSGSIDKAYYYNFNGAKTTLTVDFNGNARLAGEGVDIGAYELSDIAEDFSTVVTTFDDIVDPTDGLVSLREAIRYAASGKTVAERTVTFSSDLFPITNEGTVYLSPELQTIVIGTAVTVTSAYTNEFGETAYRDITISGERSDAPLFMLLDGADVDMRGLTFADGHATGTNPSGGAFIVRNGVLSVVDSKFVGNKADRNGGAFYQEDGSVFIVNSLMYDNSANKARGYGGAYCQTGGQAFIYNTTIAANDAAVYGGIFANDGLLVLANSIVAGNAGAQNVDVYATNIEATSNLIGAMDAWRSVNGLNGNIVGSPLSVVDPLFKDFGNRDFHLDDGSLAINSGVNAYAYGPDGVRLKLDLDANERIVGGVVDMGCYESVMADVPSTVVTTLRDVVDQEDGLSTLREAIEYAKQYNLPVTFDLGDDFFGDATIYLDSALGAIDVVSNLVIDASNIPGGLTIVGSDNRIFFVHKSGSILEDGSQTTEDGVLSLKNIALTGGTAARGGAVYMDGGEIYFTNVLIYGNDADEYGGAIYGTAGKATLLNTTIAGNEAENYQGVYFNGALSLQNTIIAANASDYSAADYNYDLYCGGRLSSVASIVGSTDAATDAVFTGYNGNTFGTSEDMVDPGFTAPESNDFSLKQDSIGVNAGSNRLVGQPGYYSSILQTASNAVVIRTDFVGADRIVGGTVDIGAYEFQMTTEAPSVVVTTLLDVVDPFDGLISLREAINYAGSSYYADGVISKVGRRITFAPELANGVIALQSPLTITKCVFVDATDVQGTITLDAGQFDEINAVILSGQADSVADEIWLAGLTITGGKADYGAGVYHTTGKATLINCVIYGNEAVYGAGVASVAEKVVGGPVDANLLKLVNVTVTKNEASGGFSGVWSIGAPVTMYNTIIAKNTTNEQPGFDVSISSVGELLSTMIGAAANGFAQTYADTDNVVGTPALPVDPVFTNYDANDFTLARKQDGVVSPAINKGDNILIYLPDGSISATDAASNLRVIGGVVDMGAYESTMGPTEIPSTMVTTLDDVVNAYDGLISLREATEYANNYGLGSTITFAERLAGGTIYLNSSLTLSKNITIDGLENNVTGITLTTANGVTDQSVIYVNSGDAVVNGLEINNRYTERRQNGEMLAVDKGGAIYVRTGSIAVYNSLIADNAAHTGSAIYMNEESESAAVTLVNCTVVANTALSNDVNRGAAIYSTSGVLNLWNTIVAANNAAGGGVAQDVYKGAVKKMTDTVVERVSQTVQVPQYAEPAITLQNGDTLVYNYQTLTYQDGAYYSNYGTAWQQTVHIPDLEQVTMTKSVTATYHSNDWFVDNVAFNFDNQQGDSATYYNALTGKTSTVYYQSGGFRLDGAPIQFNEGDTLTAPQRDVYVSRGANTFSRLNVQRISDWYGTSYVVLPATLHEYAQQVQSTLQAQLQTITSYKKTVNGVEMSYPIQSANVEITNYSATIIQAGVNYSVDFGVTARYTYVTQGGATVLNSYISLSDSLGSITAGNGSLIGTATNDLSGETASMFVDLDNADYNLVETAIATNGGKYAYLNQKAISGTFTSKDIEGRPRVYYKSIDMGAYENQKAKDSTITYVAGRSVMMTVTTARDVVNPSDGITSLREALSMADRLASSGYTDISIITDNNYHIHVDSTLGPLSINVPLTIDGYSMTIDSENSSCGFVVDTNGKVTLNNLIITKGVGVYGGGLKLSGGELVLNNCLIYECEAVIQGGAVYAEAGTTLELRNTTVAKNVSATGSGVYGADGSTIKLYNSILAKNRTPVAGQNETDVYSEGDISIFYSLIGNAGTSQAAAQLSAKAVNSLIGYGFDNAFDPMFMNEVDGNFRISAIDSPAKNAGSGAYVLGGAFDLDFNSLSGGRPVSMGAYQLGREMYSTIVTTADDVVDPYDGLISLREAIYYSADNINGTGASKPYNSAYAATNAMNDGNVYRATYYSPITFDPSLAGQTIRLTSPLMFDYTSYSGAVYDYLIDGSSLSKMAKGGITIDCSGIQPGGGGGVTAQGAFNILGDAVPADNLYWPVSLDIRNVTITGYRSTTGAESNTAFYVNNWGMLTMRNCLVDGFQTTITVTDNDSDQAGLVHVYNSTLVGRVQVEGMMYMYNTLLAGYAYIVPKQNNPAYRTCNAYSSFIPAYSGLYRFGGDTTPSYYDIEEQFVDFTARNYHLAEGSLCNNRGNNAYVQTLAPTHADAEVDAAGNGRVFSIVEIGCFESVGVLDVPSTVVTTTDDVIDYTDGLISIREAIIYAQQAFGGRTVRFSEEIAGKTITLDGPIVLERDVYIDGGANDITIDGGQNGSVFEINVLSVQANVTDVRLDNLTLTGGRTDGNGGAISIASGNVYVSNLDIYGNTATNYGGAIYAYDSELSIINSRIGGNAAHYYGGVVNEFGKTVMSNSYVAENNALISTATADIWGRAAVNYVNSRNNVVGSVADNIKLYNGVDGNRVGTAANPIKPFVNAAAGNLTVLNEWDNTGSGAVLEDAFAELADELAIELDEDFGVLDNDWFEF
ncbi:MAG: choice-of-anchor Q domain-containing protein [Thermoguttaceae bacterium]|nr:choice-of-anchor Q domain-containing protein [Thermoguttaceae bacterium]